MNRKVILLVAFLSVVWGTTYIATKIAISSIPVYLMVGLRELAAGLLMLTVAFILESPSKIKLKRLLISSILGLGFFTGARGFMTLALDYIPSGTTALIYSLIPIYVIFLNFFTPNFYINRKIIIGVLLGAIGMIMVFKDNLSAEIWLSNITGIAIALLGAFCWAGTSIISKENKDESPLLFRAASQLIVGGLALLIISQTTGEMVSIEMFTWRSVSALSYLVVFGSVLGFLAFSFSIKKYPVAQISVYAYINPFVAAFLGWYMLNETLSLYLVVSFLIAIMGVYLVNEGYRQKNRSNLKQHGTKITN